MSDTASTDLPPISLTGIKPTGEPHLGNYIGAIRPALAAASTSGSFYFIADEHSLTTVRSGEELKHYTRSVAATWLACGLDPETTTFYKQSDVPETFELAWILSCLTAKGLMNRAHAYKAALDANRAAGNDDDAGVNMGLFNYPVLMAADILIMGSEVVPVGKDQVQHVEIAADIAGVFNHHFGDTYKLRIPRALVAEDDTGRTLPGLDGRKMSKSYGNTIPLFLPAKAMTKLVKRIPTDSTPVEDPKDPDTSSVFQILEQFATPEVLADVRARLLAGGMGWGELKGILAETLEETLAPLRDRYEALMDPSSELDDLLAAGAVKARAVAGPLLANVRGAVGL